MKIQFSPPDISEVEINEVVDTLRSGWITTGPKTKLLEKNRGVYKCCQSGLFEFCNSSIRVDTKNIRNR